MIEIRKLTRHNEFESAVHLQQEIWGFADVELLPLRLFVVADKIGGQVLGAFDDMRMVAFCLGVPGLKPGGKYYLHSHMLGVLPEYRNTGLGRQMKLKQREEALERGIDLIEWTFDPLEIKNAYFNIERLGAIVRRFVHNQYGSTSSHLHGGLPTDRCTAEWWIDSPRVHEILAGQEPEPGEVRQVVSVPSEIGELRRSDPGRAREIQMKVADQFVQYFSEGLVATRFEKTKESSNYLLTEWHFA
jgi:predicted GNAT superfamily acetyltransferase